MMTLLSQFPWKNFHTATPHKRRTRTQKKIGLKASLTDTKHASFSLWVNGTYTWAVFYGFPWEFCTHSKLKVEKSRPILRFSTIFVRFFRILKDFKNIFLNIFTVGNTFTWSDFYGIPWEFFKIESREIQVNWKLLKGQKQSSRRSTFYWFCQLVS